MTDEVNKMIFENKGKENTLETLHIALNAAKERGTTLVVASSAGDTLIKLIKMQEELGTNVPMVMVGQAYGYPKQGVNIMTDERRAELTAAGVHIIHAAHALSGAERGISRKFSGAYPVEIMAHTLRMFGQGTKVCVEIAMMALDNGAIELGEPVVCVGGSARGADTTCIITPAYTADCLDTKIHEILCKPGLY